MVGDPLEVFVGLDKRWNLLYVVYIERENEIIRIISARKATRKEREYYES
ncbi:BrnT family toxin [Nostocaceae cyanobacterium CENA357]|uniref:BrnT family toxin n=2 Tax=Atlanticothrix TaxID=2840441 RepID=A0A8J7HEA2_9CYAN|nr:BrnT family toxin [Atlanticothrix silvestris CENA357]